MMKSIFLLMLTLFVATILPAQEKTDYKFSFGPKEIPGYIKVDPLVSYTDEKGYGFDFGTVPVSARLRYRKLKMP